MTRLQTARCVLRAFEESDFEDVHAYASDPEITRYQWWGPNDEAATRAFIDFARKQMSDRESGAFEFAIERSSDARVVGGCGVRAKRTMFREFELGYTLCRDVWRQGIGYEVAARVRDFAFDALGAHRLYASIDPQNAASIALATKLGMRREGVLRKDSLIRGKWRDSAIYALLEDERPGRA